MAETIKKSKGFYKSFDRKGGVNPQATHYCAGCGHGILNKLIAEAIVELGIEDKTVFVNPVGCGVFCYYYIDCGHVVGPHGRSPAVATGVTRSIKDKVVIAYQGDGDLGAIGFNNAFQAANRGEKFAHFFVNNAIYGMTGGQMAPTTLIGQKTTTSPYGRDPLNDGYPIHVSEIFNQLHAPVYIERVAVTDTANIMKAKKAVRKALEIQKEGKGYAFVEVLSPCPTNFRLSPLDAVKWVNEEMTKEFPLGCLRDRSADLPENQPRVWENVSLADYFASAKGEIDTAVVDENFNECRMKFSGFGGQGVLSLGHLIADAAQIDRRYVSWFPSYGPEQRGGSASCSVVLSGKPIGSPTVEHIDVLVAMNQPAFERFGFDVESGGYLLYDTVIHLTEEGKRAYTEKGIKLIGIPATEIAQSCNEVRAANTVFLAALAELKCTGLDAGTIRKVMEANFAPKPKVLTINQKVYDVSAEWIRNNIK